MMAPVALICMLVHLAVVRRSTGKELDYQMERVEQRKQMGKHNEFLWLARGS